MRRPLPLIVGIAVILILGILLRRPMMRITLKPKLNAVVSTVAADAAPMPSRSEERKEPAPPRIEPKPVIQAVSTGKTPAVPVATRQPVRSSGYWRAIFDEEPHVNLSLPPLTRAKDDPNEVFLTEAERYLAEQKGGYALAILSKIEKPSERALADLAVAHFLVADFSRAEEVFRRLSREHPWASSHYLNSGEMQFLQRKYREAMNQFELGRAMDPSDSQFSFWIGLVGARRGDWKTSLEAFRAVLGLDAHDLEARIRLAHALVLAGDTPAAEKELQEALATAPDRSSLYLDLVLLTLEQNKMEETMRYLNRGRVALALDSHAQEQLRSEDFSALHQRPEFSAFMETLKRPQSTSPAAKADRMDLRVVELMEKGDAATKNAHLDEAIAFYESALEIEVKSPELLGKLGGCYLNKREFGRAASLLERARNLRPNDPAIYYHLGLAYQGLGWRALAIETWKKGILLAPEDNELRTALSANAK